MIEREPSHHSRDQANESMKHSRRRLIGILAGAQSHRTRLPNRRNSNGYVERLETNAGTLFGVISHHISECDPNNQITLKGIQLLFA
jgi:hypothetical protein